MQQQQAKDSSSSSATQRTRQRRWWSNTFSNALVIEGARISHEPGRRRVYCLGEDLILDVAENVVEVGLEDVLGAVAEDADDLVVGEGHLEEGLETLLELRAGDLLLALGNLSPHLVVGEEAHVLDGALASEGLATETAEGEEVLVAGLLEEGVKLDGELREDVAALVGGNTVDLVLAALGDAVEVLVNLLAELLEGLLVTDADAGKVKEAGVGLLLVAEAGGEGAHVTEEVINHLHVLIDEDTGVHDLEGLAVDDGLGVHEGKNVLVDVDTGGNLGKLNTIRGELEDGTLSNVGDVLGVGEGLGTGEGDLTDRLEHVDLTLVVNVELAVLGGDLEALLGEGTEEEHTVGRLGDVNEATRSNVALTELGDVHVTSGGVDLSGTEVADVKTTTVVDIELLGGVDTGLRVVGRAEVVARGTKTTEETSLSGEGHVLEDGLLGSDVGDVLGSTDTKVDHVVGAELHGGTATHDLLGRHGKTGDAVKGLLDAAVERGVVSSGVVALVAVLRVGEDDGINERRGDLDVGHGESAGSSDAVDLGNDDTTTGAGSGGEEEKIRGDGLVLDGDVTVSVGGGTLDDGDINVDGLVAEVLLAVHLHDLNEVVLGELVELATSVAGVDERAETDLGDVAGGVAGTSTDHAGDGSHGEGVGLDLVGADKRVEVGGLTVVGGDGTAKHTGVAEVVGTALTVGVTEAHEHQGEVLGVLVGLVVLTEGLEDSLGKSLAHEAADENGVASAHEGGSIALVDDLALALVCEEAAEAAELLDGSGPLLGLVGGGELGKHDANAMSFCKTTWCFNNCKKALLVSYGIIT